MEDVKQTKPPIVFLKGRRVILRPVLREDTPHLLSFVNDAEVSRYVLRYFPMSEANEERWVNETANNSPNQFVLAMVADDHIIGTMGVHDIKWKDRVATTGAMIGDKKYWGDGYGTEAKMLLLKYCFDALNLRKIKSAVIAFNERSLHYSLKCGYVEEGRLKEEIFQDGKYWDIIQLAVYREQWWEKWVPYTKKHFLPQG